MTRKTIAIAAAVAGFSACTGTAVLQDTPGQEIGMAPVSRYAVKGVSGAMNGSYDYLESFGVFAYYKQAVESQDWAEFAGGESPSVYIANAEFTCRDREAGTVWGGGTSNSTYFYQRDEDAAGYVKGEPNVRNDDFSVTETPYYWPRTGYLAFAGYSPYRYTEVQDVEDGDGNSTTTYSFGKPLDASYSVSDTGNPGLTVRDFLQGTYEWQYNDHWAHNATMDLMWFDVDESPSRNSSGEAFPAVFHHACAWIDFIIDTEAGSEGMFSIYRVTLDGIFRQGTFASADGSWTDLGEKEEIVLFCNGGKPENSNDDEFCRLTSGGIRLGNLIVIPQTVPSGLTVEFRQNTSDTGNLKYEDTGGGVELPASRETVRIDLPETAGEKWEMGKHYTYTITFTADRIEISPSATEWTDSGTDIPVES